MTTEFPSQGELDLLLQTGFGGSEKDFQPRVQLLRALGISPASRVLDFGASWGYGTWQLAQAGFEVVGYEISSQRARYARAHLDVRVEDDEKLLGSGFDVFFSSHVLEHLPAPGIAFDLARRVLRGGALFVAFTPNGCLLRRAHDAAWHRAWGGVHSLMLDEVFYRKAFRGSPKLLASAPYDMDAIQRWTRAEDLTLDLSGPELLCVVAMGATTAET